MSDEENVKILVVDDEPVLCRLMETMLRRSGISDVTLAHCGADALGILGLDGAGEAPDDNPLNLMVTDYDLVLLDIMLPDINGYEVCTRIKQSFENRLPVILITGFTIEENHARYLETGADDFITKPFGIEVFVTRVRIAIERKRQAERAAQERTATLLLSGRTPESAYVGKTIGGCEIDQLLWCGSGSVICRGTDGETGEQRAVKLLTPRVASFSDVVERFSREITVLDTLDHEHITRLVSHGTHEQCPYYVMTYVPGMDLETILKEQGPFPFLWVMSVARGVADALSYVHSQGFVHRDVTLSNILMDEATGEVFLADFGIAIRPEQVEGAKSAFCVGTPLYMAPEMFSRGGVTSATDIYSYGVCLYYLITGQPPFDTSNTGDLINKHVTTDCMSMSQERAGVPPEWDQFVTGLCLAKRPEDRPQTMEQVLTLLGELSTRVF
ncbi:MAG: protein kinase [Lentisphaerae bacterium]|jgi:DNA-binding response OmpR family regulator|nr:protein kinase [Lentisphaerota bacterium]MBT4817574.1 protein kinase [Lentisphaerota bacterium]MBT5608519.1 protein kinase [Lentisphaerota bacterium]MBT7058527.1 protein kinase [Lentisphaerota bacterium]MBT7843236.1 protein kinase [Lentisphaerota bacterium]